LGLAVGIALTIYFIYLLVWTGLGRLKPKLTTEEAVWSGAFLVAATCSGCFWTLVARSTVAGVVFNVASQFITGAVAVCAIAKLFPQWLEAPKSFFVIGAIALAYSATFLWLGWSKFARLEIRDTLPATASSFSLSFPWWLRCRPQGALRNFIRKELCLQKSIVTLAALFTVGWILLAGLRYVVPILREPLEGILKLLAPIYAALSLLLAGALSIGEEKTSALNAWHLTLPISAWRQWLLKFAVSSIVGALLSGILPAGYMWLTFGRGAINGSPHELAIIILAAWLILTMSFWASTLTSSTLRSILISMLALAGVFASARLSVWVVHSYSGEIGWSPMPMIIFLLAIIATALAQSLSLFRHPQAREWAWLKCSAILTAVAVVVTVWCTALRP